MKNSQHDLVVNRYVALLRGINVGGNRKVKMEDLAKICTTLGLSEVKTYIASGNIAFDTSCNDECELTRNMENALKKKYGFDIDVIVRSKKYIQDLIAENPFRKVTVTADTRLFVTFLKENTANKSNESPGSDFYTIKISRGELFNVVIVNGKKGATDFMKILEKTYGKKITTRNWNTVRKLAEL